MTIWILLPLHISPREIKIFEFAYKILVSNDPKDKFYVGNFLFFIMYGKSITDLGSFCVIWCTGNRPPGWGKYASGM